MRLKTVLHVHLSLKSGRTALLGVFRCSAICAHTYIYVYVFQNYGLQYGYMLSWLLIKTLHVYLVFHKSITSKLLSLQSPTSLYVIYNVEPAGQRGTSLSHSMFLQRHAHQMCVGFVSQQGEVLHVCWCTATVSEVPTAAAQLMRWNKLLAVLSVVSSYWLPYFLVVASTLLSLQYCCSISWRNLNW